MDKPEFGASPKVDIDLKRYRLRPSLFDHPSEYEFYKILRDEILGSRFVAMVQIPISSLIDVERKEVLGWKAHFAKIGRKRIDFLICRTEDLQPLLVIELDGSTHSKKDRQERDVFVESLFEATGLPMLRVPVQRNYNKAVVALVIARKMRLEERTIKRLEALASN